jgi:hypothetical protein
VNSITEFNLKEFTAAPRLQYRFIRIRLVYYFLLKYIHNFIIIRELDSALENFVLNKSYNYFLDGYWQESQTISFVEDLLRKSLKLPQSDSLNYLIYRTKIERSSKSVSIHIRRTDFLKGKNREIFCVLNAAYYINALKYLEDKAGEELEFFIFGDDLQWFDDNVSLNGRKWFVTSNSPNEDVILMSMCKYNITANSTLSFWGAWLNNRSEKIIITPREWKYKEVVAFIPESWIKL